MTFRITSITLLLAIFAVPLLLPHLARGAEVDWQPVAPGLDTCAFPAEQTLTPAPVVAVRVDPNKCVITVLDAHHGVNGAGATAEEVCPPVGAAINANFFDIATLTPIGLLIADGKQINARYPKPGMYGEWGVFQWRAEHPALTACGEKVDDGVTLAVQCAPRLVIAGQIPTFNTLPAARRSAVGLTADGHVIFAVVGGAISFPKWAACLRDTLGCVDALNFDGGPSTQLAVRGNTTVSLPGTWKVPVFLTVEPKQE